MFLNNIGNTLKSVVRSDNARNFALGASFGGGTVAGAIAVDAAIKVVPGAARAVGRGISSAYDSVTGTVGGWFSSDGESEKFRRRLEARYRKAKSQKAKSRKAKKIAQKHVQPTRKTAAAVQKKKVTVRRAA